MNKPQLGTWKYILQFAKDSKTVLLTIEDKDVLGQVHRDKTIPLEILPIYNFDIAFRLYFFSAVKLFEAIKNLEDKDKTRIRLFIKQFFVERSTYCRTKKALKNSGYGLF